MLMITAVALFLELYAETQGMHWQLLQSLRQLQLATTTVSLSQWGSLVYICPHQSRTRRQSVDALLGLALLPALMLLPLLSAAVAAGAHRSLSSPSPLLTPPSHSSLEVAAVAHDREKRIRTRRQTQQPRACHKISCRTSSLSHTQENGSSVASLDHVCSTSIAGTVLT
jgi:hypothetical protein